MKYLLFALLITINSSAMQQNEKVKEVKQLPQNHECFLALTRFKGMVRACTSIPDVSIARNCTERHYAEFLNECTAEAEHNRKYTALKKK